LLERILELAQKHDRPDDDWIRLSQIDMEILFEEIKNPK